MTLLVWGKDMRIRSKIMVTRLEAVENKLTDIQELLEDEIFTLTDPTVRHMLIDVEEDLVNIKEKLESILSQY